MLVILNGLIQNIFLFVKKKDIIVIILAIMGGKNPEISSFSIDLDLNNINRQESIFEGSAYMPALAQYTCSCEKSLFANIVNIRE